jgi:hypothetical protein
MYLKAKLLHCPSRLDYFAIKFMQNGMGMNQFTTLLSIEQVIKIFEEQEATGRFLPLVIKTRNLSKS